MGQRSLLATRTPSMTMPAETTSSGSTELTVSDFTYTKVLGRGSFGKVMLAEMRGCDDVFAIKILKKTSVVEDDDVAGTMTEKRVLELSEGSPFLTKLHATFHTDAHLFFVMEFVNGGDLMYHIQNQRIFPPKQSQFYAAEIMLALWYLHEKGVIYRDLKLDNVMMEASGHLKLADFGMCKENMFGGARTTTFCGTPGYLAPEIIKEAPYGASVDFWSLGVLCYEFLVGDSPFEADEDDVLFDQICNAPLEWPAKLDPSGKDFVNRLLDRNPISRIGCGPTGKADIQRHAFFSGMDWGKMAKRQIPPPFKPDIKNPKKAECFDEEFTDEPSIITPIDKAFVAQIEQAEFDGFSFVNATGLLASHCGGGMGASPKVNKHDLRQYAWYRPELNRADVVRLLKGKAAGAFCVRESASQPGCFPISISVSPRADKLWTGLIKPTDDGKGGLRYRLFVKQKFDNIPDLIEFYHTSPCVTIDQGRRGVCLVDVAGLSGPAPVPDRASPSKVYNCNKRYNPAEGGNRNGWCVHPQHGMHHATCQEYSSTSVMNAHTASKEPATRIQTFWRSWVCQRLFQAKIEAARVIQAQWRLYVRAIRVKRLSEQSRSLASHSDQSSGPTMHTKVTKDVHPTIRRVFHLIEDALSRDNRGHTNTAIVSSRERRLLVSAASLIVGIESEAGGTTGGKTTRDGWKEVLLTRLLKGARAAFKFESDEGKVLKNGIKKQKGIKAKKGGRRELEEPLWHKLVQNDNADALVDVVAKLFPVELIYHQNENRVTAYDHASDHPRIKRKFEEILHFCGRFEDRFRGDRDARVRREHESATCVVMRATFVRGWLPMYSLQLSQFGISISDIDLCLKNASAFQNKLGISTRSSADGLDDVDLKSIFGWRSSQSDGVFINSVKYGLPANRCGWKEGFRIVAIDGVSVSSWDDIRVVLALLKVQGITDCSFMVDPNKEMDVVIKVMKYEEQFNREIEQRKSIGRNDDHFIPVLFSSSDDQLYWNASVAKRSGLGDYKYGIVMPAAERNLMSILVQERSTFDGIRQIMFQLCHSLRCMHEKGMVHADMKPLNVVRQIAAEGRGDNFVLIDFDATVTVGTPIGMKTSTAYIPPELVTKDPTSGDPIVKSEANRADQRLDTLLAHPTFDVWGFAVIMFRALTRDMLFQSDDSDNCSQDELEKIMLWNPADVKRIQQVLLSTIPKNFSDVETVHLFQVTELMSWMLQPEPQHRPQSFADVLEHPYFSNCSVEESTFNQKKSEEEADHVGRRVRDSIRLVTKMRQRGKRKKHPIKGALLCSGWPMWPELHVAASLGKIENIEQLLDLSKQSINSEEPILKKTPLHMALEAAAISSDTALVDNQVKVVKYLLEYVGYDAAASDHPIDPNHRDVTGSGPLQSLLSSLEQNDKIREGHVKMVKLLFECERCDKEQRDPTRGDRTVANLGRVSKHSAIREVFSQMVVHQLKQMTKLDKDEFMEVWKRGDRTSLEKQLWSTVDEVFDKVKYGYAMDNIFNLPIWDDPTNFAKLKSKAERNMTQIIQKTHMIRDSRIDAKLKALPTHGDVKQYLPEDAVDRLANDMAVGEFKEKLEDEVLVPLLRIRAEQVKTQFEGELLKSLGAGAVLAGHSPEHAHLDSIEPQLVYIAPVKGEKRMREKLQKKRADARSSVTKSVPPPAWKPVHLQEVGDVLRSTVECKTSNDMWSTYQQVKARFKVCRMKNNLSTSQQRPPDMLLNIVFEAKVDASGTGYPIVVELQIHLREIHVLKQQVHFLYEITRATDASALPSRLDAGAGSTGSDTMKEMPNVLEKATGLSDSDNESDFEC